MYASTPAVEPNINQIQALVAALTSRHNLLEHLELARCVKGHEVHATVPAEITSVEPVPVLQGRSCTFAGNIFKIHLQK